jgi:hypothetical protein
MESIFITCIYINIAAKENNKTIYYGYTWSLPEYNADLKDRHVMKYETLDYVDDMPDEDRMARHFLMRLDRVRYATVATCVKY